jgi:uncharacterized protein DUF6893
MEVLGWIFLGLLALVVLVAVIVLLTWIPEIRRYTRVGQM